MYSYSEMKSKPVNPNPKKETGYIFLFFAASLVDFLGVCLLNRSECSGGQARIPFETTTNYSGVPNEEHATYQKLKHHARGHNKLLDPADA